LGKLCNQCVEANQCVPEFTCTKQRQGAVVSASLHRINGEGLTVDGDLNRFETLHPRVNLSVLIAQTSLGCREFIRLKFKFTAQAFDLPAQLLYPVRQGELATTGGFKTLEPRCEVFESAGHIAIKSIDAGPKIEDRSAGIVILEQPRAGAFAKTSQSKPDAEGGDQFREGYRERKCCTRGPCRKDTGTLKVAAAEIQQGHGLVGVWVPSPIRGK
jgi:hypothetical protein